ncbi:MAG: ribose-phosphate pyrophosphokinase [Proteobacteria bacterium]|nr:ribose-phosphate pyrophosphokinase [Pseudomonadota bacterium]
MTPMVLVYPGEESLGDSMRSELPVESVDFEMRRFPDGETYLRIDSNVQGRQVVILCTLREPDVKILPLLFMADALRDLGASRVGLVAPYLAYMRQDRRFNAGEALTSRSFARIVSARFDWLITVDPHLHRRNSLSEIYTIRTEVVQAAPLLAEWIRANVSAPVVIGPDAESEQWVSVVARAIPCPHIVLKKVRHGDRSVTVAEVPDIERWGGYTPVLVDDIIASARTMIESVGHWRTAGQRAPVCLGVHAVFASGAYEALAAAGAARIVTTNSVPHHSNAIDLGPALVPHLLRVLS